MSPEEKEALVELFKFKRDIEDPHEWFAARVVRLMFTDQFLNDIDAETMILLLQELAEDDARSWQTKIKGFTERVSH